MTAEKPQAGSRLWAARPKLILASSSPRRRLLLERIGALLEVCAPEGIESPADGESPPEHVRRLALAKAEAVARKRTSGLVLGADTVVVLEGDLLGKPGSAEEARAMLRRLSGRTHRVITGIVLVDAGTGRSLSRHATTEVTFRPIAEAEIEAYLATGEPFDKAGAYGAQGYGGFFLRSVRGCFYNVVGLPLAELAEAVDEWGSSGP